MPIPFFKPAPAPPESLQHQVLPRKTANPLSKLFFHWLTPILAIGHSRPLEVVDLWKLSDDLRCGPVADRLEAQFNRRLPNSRRLAKYKTIPDSPLNSDNHGSKSRQPDTPPQKYQEQEMLLDSPTQPGFRLEPGREAALHAEVLEENALTLTMTHMSRRDSCPAIPEPEKSAARPLQPNSVPTSDSKNDELVKLYGKRKADKLTKDKIALEDGTWYDMNLWLAMYHAVKWRWLFAVFLDFAFSALRTTVPLVSRQLIRQITRAHAFHQAESLASMTFSQGIISTHWSEQVGILGSLVRSALVDLIGRKTMRLSARSRMDLTNGKLVNLVTTDAGFIEWFAPHSCDLIVLPITIVVGIGLLIYVVGYSALAGLALLVLFSPVQGQLFGKLCYYRRCQTLIVDRRIRLMTEMLTNIRGIKLYAYEKFLGIKIAEFRTQEVDILRKHAVGRSFLNSMFSFLPVLSTIVTFITYSLSGHELDSATIFTALQLFNVMYRPIGLLPVSISAATDTAVGIERVRQMLLADELRASMDIRVDAQYAIDVEGDFQFDGLAPVSESQIKDYKDVAKEKKEKARLEKQNQNKRSGFSRLLRRGNEADETSGTSTPATTEEKHSEGQSETEPARAPFSLRDIDLKIPRGALVCIVGRVGTGKTALLSGLINELRQIKGHVTFGGSVGYVPQHAWVQSGPVKDNITFSAAREDVDDARVEEVIDACCLRADIDMWQDGVETKIGERGITLSGGQRQRVCIARAAYADTDIVLLDDPLSAVDAHVGHHLLHQCILNGPFATRTRILVTHHLDVLPHADLILVMDNDDRNEGRIIQKGTYQDLYAHEGIFRTLIEEFGASTVTESELTEKADAKEDKGKEPAEKSDEAAKTATDKDKAKGGKLMLDEDRATGAVAWRVYRDYIKTAGTWWYGLAAVSALILGQCSQIGNNLFLGYWIGRTVDGFSTGQYMAVYAGFAAAIAVFYFTSNYLIIFANTRAATTHFNGAWRGVMSSPASWHDRTPTGRVISRMSKDVELMDCRLAQSWNQFLVEFLAIVGTFALICYTYPYLALIFLPLGLFFWLCAEYYRQTSREVKRLDSVLRSYVYSEFQEQLAGLAVIRAFGRQIHFEERLQKSMNDQSRAFVLTASGLAWLRVRLEACSQMLILLLGVFGNVFSDTVNDSLFGVVFTYALASAGLLTTLVLVFAQCEHEMNSVERIQNFCNLESEADSLRTSDPKADEAWPTAGAISFQDVQLRYRPDLPLVLKGLTFDIKPGEKVGIIGRTGAGKSSVAQALFRTVELCGGRIVIDGRDLRELGLETLRTRLSIIPQDAFLFAGTVRENIDPTGLRTDSELNDALSLIHGSSSSVSTMREKFKLDGMVANDGSNFSAGERQLLALMRALARQCKVLLLDEATSSVDPETDALIQRIIQTELPDVTLISIAHRLQTVAFYDRIIVLDAGQIAEFDAPLALFDNPNSAFRSLCDTKNLGREEIVRIQAEASLKSRLV